MPVGVMALNLKRIREVRANTDTTSGLTYDAGSSYDVYLQSSWTKAEVDNYVNVQYPDAAFPLDVLEIDGKAVKGEFTLSTRKIIYAMPDTDNPSTRVVVMVEQKTRIERWLVDMPIATDDPVVGFINLMNTNLSGVVPAIPALSV